MNIYKYFKYPVTLTILGFAAAFLAGYSKGGGLSNAIIALWECFILAVLEISLSFDNAIINARVVQHMSLKWQKIFLFLGIFIAVFGMRIFMPLIIVMFVLKQNIFVILHMALFAPAQYMQALNNAHLSLNVFGASFLSLVALSFFFTNDKTEHWINFLEKPVAYISVFSWMPMLINLLFASLSFYFFSKIPDAKISSFIFSFVLGVISFYAIKFLNASLDNKESENLGGWRSFLYLEILDSTFSFDGVLGAFALSNNFVIIVLGLSIGAFYVRSLTIMLVKENSLARFSFIEHGAFYAILSLAVIMYCKVNIEIPDYIAGLFSIFFISTSLLHSYYKNKLLA